MYWCLVAKLPENEMILLKAIFEEMCRVPMHWILVAPNRDNWHVLMKTVMKLGIS